MQEKEFKQKLVQRYAENKATAEELEVFFHLLKEEQLDMQLSEAMSEEPGKAGPALAPVHRIHFLRTSWFRYAAAIVLIASGAAIWYSNNHVNQENHSKITVQTDIAPGGNRAILTVGNSTINLSNDKTGITVGNAITYNDGERIADAGQQLTLTTPKGGQYQAVLPDGSKVWLNAASSIKFPSKFAGTRREVEITGEAYLEVAQSAKHPFYVTTRKTTIQVLGTSFNINAYYDEEAERTTLIDGSVRVISNNESSVRMGHSAAAETPRQGTGVLLQPNQQAVTDNQGNHLISLINGSDVIAWKNGVFNFNGKSFQVFMKDIERWYDVTVRYDGAVPDIRLKGKMDREVKLSGVLRFLSEYGVKTRLEGKVIVVL